MPIICHTEENLKSIEPCAYTHALLWGAFVWGGGGWCINIRSKRFCIGGQVGLRKMKGSRAKGLSPSPSLHHFISLFLPLLMPHPLTLNVLSLLPTQQWDRGAPGTQLHSRVLVLFQATLLPPSVNVWVCLSNIWERRGFGITDLSSKWGKGGKHEMDVSLALWAECFAWLSGISKRR